jgi:hypothetical protein
VCGDATFALWLYASAGPVVDQCAGYGDRAPVDALAQAGRGKVAQVPTDAVFGYAEFVGEVPGDELAVL